MLLLLYGLLYLHIYLPSVILGRLGHIDVGSAVLFKVINGFDRAGNQSKDSGKHQLEGVHRTFQLF